MAPPCTVCTHHQRAEIDAALIGGAPIRIVADRFDLAISSVGRHERGHLTAITAAVHARVQALSAAAGAQHAEAVTGLVLADAGALAELAQEARDVADGPDAAGAPRLRLEAIKTAAGVLGERRASLVTVGKATGEIGADVEVKIDFGGGEVRGQAAEAVRMLARLGAWLRDAHPELVDEARAALGEGGGR